jgi:hypothetical protein
MSKQLRIPIIFHPPTEEEYNAEEVAFEVMMNAFGACKIDYPEMTDSVEEVLEWLELFDRDLAKFRRLCRMTFRPDVYPNRPISTGTLILNIL